MTQEKYVEDEVVAKTGLTVDAEDLVVKMNEGKAAVTKSLLCPEANGGRQEEAKPSTGPLEKLPAARSGRCALPSGGASTYRVKEAEDGEEKERSLLVGVSTLKLTALMQRFEIGSKPKTGGVYAKEDEVLVNKDSRRKTITE